MENIPSILADLALILISGGVMTILFKWLKQPVVLGYIVAGFLVSSQISLTPTISGTSDIGTWADIGVIFLLFCLGLDFSFKKLIKVGQTAAIGAITIITFMILLGFLVGVSLGWGIFNSLLLGGMISMSSTAIIIKAFDDMGLRNQSYTRYVFGILIVEDLIAILLMVLISTLAVSKSFEGESLIMAILKLIFFLVVWLIGGIYFIPIILRKAKKVLNDETLLVFSLGLCFGMVLFAKTVGFSSALGAFVMGSILAETLDAERIERLVRPLKDTFGAIFFVSVGMMVDFAVITQYIVPIIIITLAIIFGQIIFGTCGLLLANQPLKTAIQSGFCLTQIGEFAFIIAMLGINLKVIDPFIYPVIVAVSVITIFLTPYIMRLSEPAYNFISSHMPESWANAIERRSTSGKSAHVQNVWYSLLSQIIRIIFVYSMLTIAIELLSIKYFIPFVTSKIEGYWGAIVGAGITILIISPLLRAMVAKKNHSLEFKYLWKTSKYNHAPLLATILLRFFLAATFVYFILLKTAELLHINIGFLFIAAFVICAAIIIVLMLRSRRIKLYSITLERKFMHNLNSREYEEIKKSRAKEVFGKKELAKRLSAHDLHLVDFEVPQFSKVIGYTLRRMNFHQKHGVYVVSIMRGKQRINIPSAEEVIFPFDKLLVLGSDEQLKSFSDALNTNNEEWVRDTKNTGVVIEQFQISEKSTLAGKSISQSGIKEHSKCMVVGIEHEGVTTMNPSPNTTIEQGDFIWIVGEAQKIQELMKNCESIYVLDQQ
ncbi:MAG: cation:proton antiporter [Paludibacteraceae bacterium]|nr:cation:proton antiporter [Paludibacteraceae bacterium]